MMVYGSADSCSIKSFFSPQFNWYSNLFSAVGPPTSLGRSFTKLSNALIFLNLSSYIINKEACAPRTYPFNNLYPFISINPLLCSSALWFLPHLGTNSKHTPHYLQAHPLRASCTSIFLLILFNMLFPNLYQPFQFFCSTYSRFKQGNITIANLRIEFIQ